MKATDLRIGNWVCSQRKQIFQIDATELLEITKNPILFSPIEINKDILGKCLNRISDQEFEIEIPVGWSRDYHTGFFFKIMWYEYIATEECHTGWRPYLQKPKAYPQLSTAPPVEELFLWGYIEYLHQLQNYYYEVTRSELNVVW